MTYSTDKPAGAVPMFRVLDCVGVNIRTPRKLPLVTERGIDANGISFTRQIDVSPPHTVSFYFETTDAGGIIVERRPLQVNIDDPALVSDADYTTIFAALKRVAYKLAERAGYPTGGTVT